MVNAKTKEINHVSDISVEERLQNMEQILNSIKKEIERIAKLNQPIIKN